jgi:hypothetical protein
MQYKLAIIAAILFISCNKNGPLNIPETGEPPIYFGECSLYNNGVLQNNFLPMVIRDGYSLPHKNYSLQLYVYDIRNFKRIELTFNYLSFKNSNYTISKTINSNITGSTYPTSGYYTIQSGGDVLEEKYYVDSTKPCVLNITKVDSTTKELWGDFKGTYLLQRNASTPVSYTNTTEITNGTFHTKVFE